MSQRTESAITIRHDLRPGDIGEVTRIHGVLYAAEFGFDETFEAYVAASLGEFGIRAQPDQDRLWLAEVDGEIVGSIGILGRDDGVAQLRWFLVDPRTRGQGLGRELLERSIDFCRSAGYQSIHLWTVHTLTGAARLYRASGFELTEEKPSTLLWSQELAEQRYDLLLKDTDSQ